ncbi:MAG: thiol peroxidase [Oligoflexia bacterium]|nr:thiol peroxidase [Oligoflexia bacterium]
MNNDNERIGLLTVKGNPLTLIGKELKVGEHLPDIELLNNDLNPVRLSHFLGKICIISTVPSLDTPICDLQTKKFNETATRLGNNIIILTVSMDLPFAQKRWCGANNIEKVITLSDHREAALGKAFGILVKELRLLARAIFVIDKEGKISYVQLVKELSHEPDYDAVLKEVHKLIQ